MNRLMQLCLGLYVPHLLEEGFTRMYDDPLIVFALAPLSGFSPRQAAYLIFQLMLGVSLSMTYLYGLGGRFRDAVMVVLSLALLGESHHALRWLASHQYNPGLLTSLPMPVLGAFILRAVFDSRTAVAG
jgi:Protein of unknown function with HXXEE motif